MKTYLVGGTVRDQLLGRLAGDRDWVVVGATADQMRNAGFKQVGAEFPVFLHPVTGEEYALARTERKSAPGYRGFVVHAAPDVTLEQDLARRDLTINAMAIEPHSGELIDPFGGQADLRSGILRHVGPAFAEDPVRLLRVARFAARWPQFTIAPETAQLLKRLVDEGEVDALVPERVWQELARGLMEARPSRVLEVLRECGALARLLPDVDRLWGVPQPPEQHPEVDTGVHLLLVLDMCARLQAPLAVRFAALCHDLGKGSTPRADWPRHSRHEDRSAKLAAALAKRWRVPSDCRELALIVAREHTHVHTSAALSAVALMRLLERCDALRRPERFAQVLLACECDARGRTGLAERTYAQGQRLERALAAARAVDATLVAAHAQQRGLADAAIGQAIHAARVRAVEKVLALD
jgi:tRNA nucleotidyltransferase (CCA-adding enzyme)